MSLSSLYLDAFLICAQVGHFTEAAEKLHITQSALSQRIARLEEDLEVTLFLRDRSGVRLTPSGQELLRYCLAKDSIEKESLSRIRGEESSQLTGVIRIGGFSSVMRSVILPSLGPLLKDNPQLKFQMISREMDELWELMKRGEIDYMVHYNSFYKDEIETLNLGVEKNALVEKKGYKGPDVFLDHDENDQATAQYLKLSKDKGIYQRRFLDDVYGLIDGVKQGTGRAIIPLHLIKNEKDVRVINKKVTLDFPVVLHYFKRPYYTRLHDQVVQSLKTRASQFLK